MIPLYQSQAKYLQSIIYQDYHLKIKIETAQGIIKALINQDVQQSMDALTHVKGDIIFRLFEGYYATTKLPFEERKSHSAYFFAHYVNRRYWIIALPKLYWLMKIKRLIDKYMKKFNDSMLLFSQKHQYNNWGAHTKIRWLNRLIDWIICFFHKPKLTESNLEKFKN